MPGGVAYNSSPSSHSNASNQAKGNNKKMCMILGAVYCGACVLFSSINLVLLGHVYLIHHSTVFTICGLFGDIFSIITFVLLLLGMGYVLYTDNSHSGISNTEEEKHSFIVITFIFILGFGDSLCNLARFGDQLIVAFKRDAEVNNICWNYIVVSFTENGMKCIVQLCILTFILYQLSHPKNSESLHARQFTLGLSLYCLFAWCVLIFQKFDYDKRNKNDSCINYAIVNVTLYENFEAYLYPLGLEFRFACFIELLVLSNPISIVQDSCNCCLSKFKNIIQSSVHQSVQNSNSPRTSHDSQTESSSNQKQTSCFLRLQHFCTYIVFRAMSVILVSISMILVLFQVNNEHNDNNLTTITSEICEIVLGLLSFIYSAFSLKMLCKSASNNRMNASTTNMAIREQPVARIVINADRGELEMTAPNATAIEIAKPNADTAEVTTPNADTTEMTTPNATAVEITTPNADTTEVTISNANTIVENSKSMQYKFTIDFSFLLLAYVCILAYSIITLRGAILFRQNDESSKVIKILTMFASIIPILQSSMQSFIIWKFSKSKEHNLNVAGIEMWIALSFAIWLFDTFSAKEFSTNKIQIAVYHHPKWDIIETCVIPMAIFFRFHSCIIFANIRDGVY